MYHTTRLKRCKRCGGNLCLERDEYGAYVSCIQCGAVYEVCAEQDIRRSNSRLPVEVGSGNAEGSRVC